MFPPHRHSRAPSPPCGCRSPGWASARRSRRTSRAQAAETFGAEGQYLSAAKKLLDTRCPAFRSVTAVRNRIVSYWRGISLPYPEPGIRLIRQDRIESFDGRITDLRQELLEAIEELDRQYDDLRRRWPAPGQPVQPGRLPADAPGLV